MPADPPVAVPGPASERDPDDAYEDLERADHIDALCYELVESDQVPPDVLAPIQSYAVWLRNRARESERCRYKPGCDCGYCAAQDALAALPAVGERDKAEIEAGQLNADVVADVHGLRDRLADWVIGDGTMISLRDVLDELCRILDPTVPPAGERDRQQIARLTEALAFYANKSNWNYRTGGKQPRATYVGHRLAEKALGDAAVLADEEDAG